MKCQMPNVQVFITLTKVTMSFWLRRTGSIITNATTFLFRQLITKCQSINQSINQNVNSYIDQSSQRRYLRVCKIKKPCRLKAILKLCPTNIALSSSSQVNHRLGWDSLRQRITSPKSHVATRLTSSVRGARWRKADHLKAPARRGQTSDCPASRPGTFQRSHWRRPRYYMISIISDRRAPVGRVRHAAVRPGTCR